MSFRKLHDNAIIPTRATAKSAGYDLYAVDDYLIDGLEGSVLVKTGVAFNCPPGLYGRIAMRSGLAVKQHLTVSAGVVDEDYPGEIGVVVSRTAPGETYIKAGTPIAQLVFEKYHTFEEVETKRTGGFGSTSN